MPTSITRGQVGTWKAKAEALRTRVKNLSKKTDKVVVQAVHSTEVGGAAFIAGIIQGRSGSVEVVGVPLELALALGLHGAAFVGLGGKMAPHLHGFADGFMGAYMACLGRGVGVKMRLKTFGKATAKKSAKTTGESRHSLPSAGVSLTDEDVYYARMAEAIS